MARIEFIDTVRREGACGVWSAIMLHDGSRCSAMRLPLRESDREIIDHVVASVREVAQVALPGVAPVADVVVGGDQVWLLVGMAPRPSLADLLNDGSVSAADVALVASDTGRTLLELHERGLSHQAFGPDTTVLSSTGEAIVTEVGVAGALRDGAAARDPSRQAERAGADVTAWSETVRILASQVREAGQRAGADALDHCADLARAEGLRAGLRALSTIAVEFAGYPDRDGLRALASSLGAEPEPSRDAILRSIDALFDPQAAAAAEAAEAPRSGPPAQPVSGAPVSAAQVSGAPVSGAPVSGTPVSGSPVSGAPTSGLPVSGGPSWYTDGTPHVPRTRRRTAEAPLIPPGSGAEQRVPRRGDRQGPTRNTTVIPPRPNTTSSQPRPAAGQLPPMVDDPGTVAAPAFPGYGNPPAPTSPAGRPVAPASSPPAPASPPGPPHGYPAPPPARPGPPPVFAPPQATSAPTAPAPWPGTPQLPPPPAFPPDPGALPEPGAPPVQRWVGGGLYDPNETNGDRLRTTGPHTFPPSFFAPRPELPGAPRTSDGATRFGPGVPIGEQPLPTRTGKQSHWPRLVVNIVLTAAIVVGIVGYVVWRSGAPLHVKTVSVSVDRHFGVGCQLDADISGTVTTTGSGTLTYQWQRNDGVVTGVLTTKVTDSSKPTIVHLRWIFSGPGNQHAGVTLLVLGPDKQQAATTFDYICSN